jgi:O-antigen ligase
VTSNRNNPTQKIQLTLSEKLSTKKPGDPPRSTVRTERMNPFSRVLNVIVFCGLLGVIALAVFPYGTVDPWWEAAFECAVFLLTALWIVASVVAGDWQIRQWSVLLPLILITAYAFLQAVQWPPWGGASVPRHMLSVDHYQTYLTARKSIALTLFLLLLLAHTSTVGRLRWLVRAVVTVGTASALFAILRQFLQPAESTTGFVLPFLFYGIGYGQFLSPNAFAYLMEMTLALLAGLVLGAGVSRKQVLIYLALAAVVWTALVLSNSRGGLLSLACGSIFALFVALTWYSERKQSQGEEAQGWINQFRTSRLVHVSMVGLMLVILMVGVLWIGGEGLSNKLDNQAAAETSDGTNRREIWRASWNLFKSRPWTGTGFGAYYLVIPQFQSSSGRIKLEQSHNDYLDLAANGGVVALALAGWFVVVIIWRAKYSFRARDAYRRAAALGAATGLIGVAVHSFVDFGLQLTGIAVVCGTLIAILVADISAQTASVSKKSGVSRERRSALDPSRQTRASREATN